jgi:hypothetical protein
MVAVTKIIISLVVIFCFITNQNQILAAATGQ